jgi:hypothetical protein
MGGTAAAQLLGVPWPLLHKLLAHVCTWDGVSRVAAMLGVLLLATRRGGVAGMVVARVVHGAGVPSSACCGASPSARQAGLLSVPRLLLKPCVCFAGLSRLIAGAVS